MSRLDEIETFVAIVEAGSLSGAARADGIALSAVSRRLKDLELRVGTTLLQRSTRSLSLTDQGRDYFLRCRQVLADLAEAETHLRDVAGQLTGTIRIAAPVTFSTLHLAPLFSAFMDQHPEVALDIDLSDRRVDLIEEGFDLAVRIGRLKDSTLVARRLTPVRHVPTAAPALLDRLGVPDTPEAMGDFPVLRYSSTRAAGRWDFIRPDGTGGSVTLTGRMRCNNGDLLVSAAAQGLGLCLEPTFVTGPLVRDGRLVPLFADHIWSDNAAYVVYAGGRQLPRRVRAFIDHLAAGLSADPWWDRAINDAPTPGAPAR
ncbi:MAG: LysR family transcriptional regulator [Rhodobacteraceae bacterium]|nr:LysR family transcriptional regulator [Paracoccaceae bacterium]